MAEALDWVIVIIAGSSLFFASIALIQIKMTTKSVNSFLKRADKFLKRIPKDITDIKEIITPEFVGDAIAHTVTKDLKNPDGSPVSMPQYIDGYITVYGPGLKEEFKKELPNIVTHILNPQNPPPPGPGGPQNPGRDLANERWHGSGGLNAATKVAKAAKKLPFANKVAEYVEGAQALVQMVEPIRELKHEISMAMGKGDNSGEQQESSPDQGQPAWGPPY